MCKSNIILTLKIKLIIKNFSKLKIYFSEKSIKNIVLFLDSLF